MRIDGVMGSFIDFNFFEDLTRCAINNIPESFSNEGRYIVLPSGDGHSITSALEVLLPNNFS
jgi:hypothetical protein